MFFYSIVYEGGTRFLGTDKNFNKWLSFVSEKPIDLSLKEFSPKGYSVAIFHKGAFQKGQACDVALGSPPIIVEEVVLISKGERRLFPDWLKRRLEEKEFQGEEWWIFRSKATGFLFVRMNQPNLLGRRCEVIRPAFRI